MRIKAGSKKSVFKLENFIHQVSIILWFSDYRHRPGQLPADGFPGLDVVNIFNLLGFREQVGMGDDVVLHHGLLLPLLVVNPLPTNHQIISDHV